MIRIGVHRIGSPFCKPLLVALLLLLFVDVRAQDSVLESEVTLNVSRITLYDALNRITDLTGYFFIYDSKDVDSDKRVKISATNKPLRNVLALLLNDSELHFRVIDKHILIYRQHSVAAIAPHQQAQWADTLTTYQIRGRVFDKEDRKPMPYVSVGIVSAAVGTITNSEGYFVLTVAPEYLKESISLSHLGYKTQRWPISLLTSQVVDMFLETEFVSLQEVIIRNYDARAIVRKAFQERTKNYSNTPTYLTTFYREGVSRDTRYINYSEAIFSIYKAPYGNTFSRNQVKHLKSRRINSARQQDTLVVKIKSGVGTSLDLDIVKSLPDFFDPAYFDNYTYSHVDIITMDSRTAFVISFVQKEHITEPLYKGLLYIDDSSFAILGADFEINQLYVTRASSFLVVKSSPKYRTKPVSVKYSIRYQKHNGVYFLKHVRSDLRFKVRRRHRFFATDYDAFLEMATIGIDSVNVERYSRREQLSPNAIFSDQNFSYDEKFWGSFNFITPESNVLEALQDIKPIIERIEKE
ncbi:MAG: carboxypeptidase-like regulatory domain-containing protein [Bacteroidales bacterium]|nr:carboxypeptidase-like regulatory domain-containing protein [Bacteroidales bacterium]MBN2748847.1 carboxypeptidase-like regulatory domain-containing protein [Bacteroidales bacterium]